MAFLIKFSSSAAGDFQMFSDAAVELLRLAGHSGRIPGALEGAELVQAHERLKNAIEKATADDTARSVHARSGSEQTETSGDTESEVTLSQRAWPLLEMMRRAIDEQAPLVWDSG